MREFKRGDRVKFLNDNGSGSVTRLIDKQMVMVRTDEGFEYPVLRSELINTTINEAITVEKDENAPSGGGELVQESTAGHGKPDTGKAGVKLSGPVNVFLAVEPQFIDEPVGGEADILMINDSPYHILFHCSIILNESMSETVSAGILEPDTKLIIGTEHLDDLFAGGRGLEVKVIAYGHGRQNRLIPVSQVFSPGREFMTSRSAYSENDFTDGDSWIVKVEPGTEVNEYNELASSLMDSFSRGMPGKDSEKKAALSRVKDIKNEEVDLHIAEIVDDSSGLSPGEILNMQLARFRTSLDGAVKARQKKIIFIHGAGEGKLKHEIRRIIDREYPRCNYQDASFREYGFGATLVVIR